MIQILKNVSLRRLIRFIRFHSDIAYFDIIYQEPIVNRTFYAFRNYLRSVHIELSFIVYCYAFPWFSLNNIININIHSVPEEA